MLGCGGVGLLLLAGMAGAQPFPGGLPACQAALKTCNATLGTCTTDLGACEADLGTCSTDLNACTADLTATQADLATCMADLGACQAEPNAVFPGDGVDGPVLSYTDNGDGTITDNNTLLVWEKKVAGGGAGTCLTDLHGVNSTCTWAQATGAWIAAINAANLGGHSDWRVPNIKELQSLVDYGRVNPAIAPSFPGLTA